MDSKKTMVLVVGAPASHLNRLKSSLESLGCDVLQAQGLFPCVRSVMESRVIPVVFFDLESSRGSYPDLLEQLHQSPIRARIVVTSRKNAFWDYLDAMQFGAHDFLASPFDKANWLVSCKTRKSGFPIHPSRSVLRKAMQPDHRVQRVAGSTNRSSTAKEYQQ